MLLSPVESITVMTYFLFFPKRVLQVYNFDKIQKAHVLTKTRRREQITQVLQLLHWVPVSFRINFKVLLLVFQCLDGVGLSYLSALLLPYEPSRPMRSSGCRLLVTTKVRTPTYGEASFHFGPCLQSRLPQGHREH